MPRFITAFAGTIVLVALVGCHARQVETVPATASAAPSAATALGSADVPPPPADPGPNGSSGIYGPVERIEDALDPEGLRVLTNPAWAEVLVLHRDDRDVAAATRPATTGPATIDPATLPRTVDGEAIAAGSPRLPPPLLAEMAALLRDERSYRFGTPGYLYRPTVVVRFGHADGAQVDVGIDADYSLLKGTAAPAGFDLWPVGGHRAACFAPARPALVRLLKAAFPGRPEVASLTEAGRRVWSAMGDEVRLVLTEPDAVEALLIDHAWPDNVRVERALMRTTFPAVEAAARFGFDRTERWRADVKRIAASVPARERVGRGYEVRGRGPRPDAAAVVAVLVDDDDAYSAGFGPICFNPGIAYRFTRAGRSITVLVCLECSKIGATTDGFPDPAAAEKQLRFGVLSTNGRARQIELAKRLFPDDPGIQSIGKPAAGD